MSLLDFVLSNIIFFFVLLTTISCQETCSSVQCDVDQPKISFPFGIKELQSNKLCAYPGFNLECSIWKKTMLVLPPGFGRLSVRDINYITKEIRLFDGYNCLPEHFMESGGTNISPFRGFASHTYRFYDNCPVSVYTNVTTSQTLALHTFSATCMNYRRPPFITPYSSSDPTQVRVNQLLIDSGCLLKASVVIPIPSSAAASIYSYNLVTDDLYLTWTDPEKNENQPNTETGNGNTQGTPIINGNDNSRETPGTPINDRNGNSRGTPIINGNGNSGGTPVNNGTSPGKEENKGNVVAKFVGISVGGLVITSIAYFLWGKRAALKTGKCYARVCCCSGLC